MQKQRVSAFGAGIFLIVIVLFFSVGFESETNSGISLDELEQNQYTVTPTTIPLTVTSETITPLSEKLNSDTQSVTAETQSVTAETINQNNSPGTGFIFPLLHQAFGIGSTQTTLNFESWDMQGDFDSMPIRMDESGGVNDGSLYMAGFNEPIIHRFDPSDNSLTKWTAPLGSYSSHALTQVSDDGMVYFIGQPKAAVNAFAGKLNPTNDEITLWDLGKNFDVGRITLQETADDIMWFGEGNNGQSEIIYSLNTATDELKTWDVESICDGVANDAGGAFGSVQFRPADGLVYAGSLERASVCVLNPTTNAVIQYDAGGSMHSSWRSVLDSNGVMYFIGGQPIKTLGSVDTSIPEAKIWDINSGQAFSWDIEVDQNDSVWFVSRVNGGVNDIGLVRLVPSTNVITEWDLDQIVEFSGHLWFPDDGTGDIWAVMENAGTNTNDHIVRYCDGVCS